MHSVYYDLHIHTALSPCADNAMVPCDIVGMAILNNLDAIAITDHNCLANAKAVIDAAGKMADKYELEKTLIVIPGLEVTTSEEVHVICLFENIDSASAFESELNPYYTQLENRRDVFGEQRLLDSDDNIIGELDRMLMAPTTITFDHLFELVREYSGAFVPAHIDRGSFSVTSNLAFLPPNLGISAIEFTSRDLMDDNNEHDFDAYPDKKIVLSSDAHQLHVINERTHFFDLPERSAKAVIDYLRFPLK